MEPLGSPPPPEEVGPLTVRWARRAVEHAVRRSGEADGGDPLASVERAPEALRPRRGVFVTLETYPGGRLRGCIGYPLPVYPLHLALRRAARAAALEDPRFPPVRAAELDALTVEVSVLSLPETIEGPPEDRPSRVVVGRDGLIVEAGEDSGLLLPQVAVEQGWDARQLLDGTCEKAGLPRGAWRRAETRVQRFTAEVFREASPRGPVGPGAAGPG